MVEAHQKRQKTSPWLYLGCGCLVLFLLAIGSVGIAGYLGVVKVTDYIDDLNDPATRDRNAKKLLGTEELPQDYHALFFLKIPWLVDLVVLTDSEQVASMGLEDLENSNITQHMGDHLFFYLEAMRGAEVNGQEDFIRTSETGEIQLDLDEFDFDSLAVLDQGTFELGVQQVTYTTHRGNFTDENNVRHHGVSSFMQVDCPENKRVRGAAWFSRLSSDANTVEELSDRAVELSIENPLPKPTLKEFMAHFNLCDG